MKKRVLSLALALLMVLSLVPMSALAAEDDTPLTGDISVGTADQLAALGGKTIEGNITLTADIDMSDTSMEPIKNLTGCFNGDGKTISGLALTGSNYSNTGLIGKLDGSVINLKMTDASITGIGNNNNAGILVGAIPQGSTSKIDNCYISGTITSTTSNTAYVGGLVGKLGQTSVLELAINNSVSDVVLNCKAINYVGGLIGATQYDCNVKVTNCAILGNVTADGYNGCAGGLFGSSLGGTLSIENTIVAGKITGTKKGVIAYATGAPTTTANNFYYDSTLNPPEKSSWGGSDTPFPIFPTKYSGVTITGEVTPKTTEEIKALDLTGFEKNTAGYPVPVWAPVNADGTPKPIFSCALTFTGVEDGVLTVKDSEGMTLTAVDGVYTLDKAGEYIYSVTFDENSDYNNIEETTFTVEKTDTQKNIAVKFTHKTAKPEGEGTKESPILIGTAAELRYFAEQVNDGKLSNAYVELKNDITVPGSWTPLGKNTAAPFSGHFDGKGYSVTITVDNPSLSYFGFFGCLDSKLDRDSETPIDDQPTVTVENLTVNGTVYCSEPGAFVGGVAARARGKVELKNCVNKATISSLARASAGVGGLIGAYDDGVDYVYKNIRMTVDGCANNGTISVTGSNTDAMVGGLVGANQNCVQVKNSQNTATINAPGCTVGGLLGEAGSQTGDFVPSIADSSNSGTLIGAEGKTNNLYGKGTIRSGNVTNSGDNTYTGGSESEDALLKESQKYNDVLAVPAGADVGTEVSLLKSGVTADENIAVTCSLGERDTHKDYLKVVGGKLQLAKKNNTGKVIEATATITWSKDGKSLSKPVTVNIYPASTSRKTLMDNIAATYTSSSSDWVVFDMAVYGKLNGTTSKTSDEARTNYLNLTINELAGTSPLVTDRAKAEIILAALGVNSTQLKPLDGELYSNAAKLAAMDLGSSHYTAPWVLLAEQAGQVKLTDSQRNSMISLLTDSQNLGSDGLFFTKWGSETYSDPDTTGTALAALAAYQSDAAVKAFMDKAIAGLSKAQNSNGSYGNVNSDAMVITGLTAVGIDPATDNRFVKGGCSLADALLLYVNDAKNGFTTTYSSGTQGEKAQALATEQGFRALVTLEKFDSLNSDTKSYNIYTQTAKFVQGSEVTETKPGAPSAGFASDKAGTPDTGSDSGSTGGTTTNWISTTVTIKPDSSTIWYAGTVRVEEGATVEQALKQAAGNEGMTLDIKGHYLRSVTYQGKNLGQFDQGPNSGWLYKVNGKAPNVGIGDYTLTTGGESIVLYYTADYTKEDDLDISKPSGGGSAGGGTTTTPTEPTTPTCPFTDITTHWAKDAVTAAWSKGWIKGVSETAFAPENQMTRGMLVTVLHRLDGEPTAGSVERAAFHDVASDAYYAKAVAWAAENGIVKGVREDLFAPDASITREQLAAILYRYANDKKMDTTQGGMALHEFADESSISDYARDAMEWAVNVGLLQGVGEGKLAPQGTATRAQVATMLVRFDGLNTTK